MAIHTTEEEAWFTDYTNFLVSKIIPHGLTYHLRKKFLDDVKYYIWDDPYLFKYCPDRIIRRCVFGNELHAIIEQCHQGPTGGHYGTDSNVRKIFEAGFYWLTIFNNRNETMILGRPFLATIHAKIDVFNKEISLGIGDERITFDMNKKNHNFTIFKDAGIFVQNCKACQRSGNISSRNQMPLTNILVFDYVSKWVEVEALPTNDARVVVKFLRKIFSRFGVPKALISDRGTHFCNSIMEKTLKKYGVTHKLATTYHPQTSGQTKNTNHAINRILERTVNGNRKEWADKLDDALWAFRTAYKSPTGSTPFRIVYGKAWDMSLFQEATREAIGASSFLTGGSFLSQLYYFL
ncbi:reverse transcriptase domain-containing protein [Tanacetum coccineum]